MNAMQILDNVLFVYLVLNGINLSGETLLMHGRWISGFWILYKLPV